MKDDELFKYLVAPDELNDFLGYKGEKTNDNNNNVDTQNNFLDDDIDGNMETNDDELDSESPNDNIEEE